MTEPCPMPMPKKTFISTSAFSSPSDYWHSPVRWIEVRNSLEVGGQKPLLYLAPCHPSGTGDFTDASEYGCHKIKNFFCNWQEPRSGWGRGVARRERQRPAADPKEVPQGAFGNAKIRWSRNSNVLIGVESGLPWFVAGPS